MTKKSESASRRQAYMDLVNPPEDLDRTPIEVPAGAKAGGKTVEQQIQEQIAIQLAKKKLGA